MLWAAWSRARRAEVQLATQSAYLGASWQRAKRLPSFATLWAQMTGRTRAPSARVSRAEREALTDAAPAKYRNATSEDAMRIVEARRDARKKVTGAR